MRRGLEVPYHRRETCLTNYILIRMISKGTFGRVWLARHILTGQLVALKFVKKKLYSSHHPVRREVTCMRNLKHPGIVRLREALEDEEDMILVMDYVPGGDLSDYLIKYGPLSEAEARHMFRQLVSALQYLHSKGIAHRDLKPENILLEEDGTLKITDFGSSKSFMDQSLMTLCGTPIYTAPEVLQGGSYGPIVDVWSLGVVLYNIVTGALPFQSESFLKRHHRMLILSLPDYLTPELQHLLISMIEADPDLRATIDTIMKDPWVNNRMDELVPYVESTRCFDPKRLSVSMPSLLLQIQGRAENRRPVYSCPPALSSSTCIQESLQAEKTEWSGGKTQGKLDQQVACHKTTLVPPRPTQQLFTEAILDSSSNSSSFVSFSTQSSFSASLSSKVSSSSPQIQGSGGKVRRVVNFIRKKCCCCVPWESNRVHPTKD